MRGPVWGELGGLGGLWIREPGRFGDFGPEWVRKFFAAS
jgi:hypothetical protein